MSLISEVNVRVLSILVVSAIALMRASSAEAGSYRDLEGDVAIILEDPRSLAVSEKGSVGVFFGETILGMDVSAATCRGTAETMSQILNDTSDPTTYLPSTATCRQLTVTDSPWFYVPAVGDDYRWAFLPPGSYNAIVVHVLDNEAVATARKGKTKVALAKMLGMSVGGRVNEQLIQGIAAELQERKAAFYCTTVASQ